MLRRTVLFVAAVVSISSRGAANASDWDGFYVGFNLGKAYMEADATRTISNNTYFAASSITALQAASAQNLDDNNFAGGAQAGYNWPFAEQFTFGAEIEATDLKTVDMSSATVVYPCCGPDTFTTTNRVEQRWMTTARLRLGFTTEWGMIYATGGYAGSDVTFTQSFSDTFFPIPLQTIKKSEFLSGYALGGGFEAAVLERTSVKLEYLYADLGDITATGPIGTGTTTSNGQADVSTHLIRAGVNFNFSLD